MSNDHNRRHPAAHRPPYETGRSHAQHGQPGHAQHGQPGGRAYPQAGRPAMPGEDHRAGSDVQPGRAGNDVQAGRSAPSGSPRSGGPQPGSPQSGGPQSAPRKRSRWRLVFGGLFVVMILGLAGLLAYALGWADPIMNALGVDRNTGQAADGRMNRPIADGTFEFTVTAARCGLHQVGEGDAGQRAQGQFCLIDVTVKNVGSSPVVFDDISQTAYDGTGNQYSADASADVVANKDRPAFLQAIGPGATVQGRLAFDISTRETLTAIVLHESIFSDGVHVPLVT